MSGAILFSQAFLSGFCFFGIISRQNYTSHSTSSHRADAPKIHRFATNTIVRAVHNCYYLQRSMEFFSELSSAAGGVYGSTLSPKEVAGQALVTKGCLAAGIALNALDNPVMEEALLHFGVRLPSATHLANYIPFILSEEVRKTIGGDVMISCNRQPRTRAQDNRRYCVPVVSAYSFRFVQSFAHTKRRHLNTQPLSARDKK